MQDRISVVAKDYLCMNLLNKLIITYRKRNDHKINKRGHKYYNYV